MLALCVMPLVHAGCISPTQPPPPPGGGRTLALSEAVFDSTVEPVLERHGCDAGGDCHGGGIRGTLALSPQSAKDPHFDFLQVSLQVNAYDPAQSAILTKPLAIAAGGTPHSVKPFATTSDPDYQAILHWIEAGVQP